MDTKNVVVWVVKETQWSRYERDYPESPKIFSILEKAKEYARTRIPADGEDLRQDHLVWESNTILDDEGDWGCSIIIYPYIVDSIQEG